MRYDIKNDRELLHIFNGFRVAVLATVSDGLDDARVIYIDTNFEPGGEDGGPGIRVILNDNALYDGVDYEPGENV